MRIQGRKKIKIVYALQGGNAGLFNMQYLNSVPLELLPKVFVFLQNGGQLSGTEGRNLERLFQVIRSRPGAVSTHNDQRKKSLDDHLRTKLAVKNAALIKGLNDGGFLLWAK